MRRKVVRRGVMASTTRRVIESAKASLLDVLSAVPDARPGIVALQMGHSLTFAALTSRYGDGGGAMRSIETGRGW